MTDTCATCRFYAGLMKDMNGVSAGQCLFTPPLDVPKPVNIAGIHFHVTRPITYAEMTCGEHQPREQKEPAR